MTYTNFIDYTTSQSGKEGEIQMHRRVLGLKQSLETLCVGCLQILIDLPQHSSQCRFVDNDLDEGYLLPLNLLFRLSYQFEFYKGIDCVFYGV